MTVHSSRCVGLAVVLLAGVSISPARGAVIVAGPTFLPTTAIMDLTLLPNTPFNPGPTAILLTGVSGTGSITINRDTEVGTTINIPTLSGGLFYGSNPALGTYVFGNIPPLTGADFSGTITNVVQNPNDPGFATGQPSSFQSGNFSFGGKSFGFQFLSGPAAGVTLFTDPSVPFQFSAVFDGLPPSAGTVLKNSGPDVLNVLFNGQVVAQTSNRSIVELAAVPEPSGYLLLGLGAVATALGRWRVRTSRVSTGQD